MLNAHHVLAANAEVLNAQPTNIRSAVAVRNATNTRKESANT